MSCSMQLVDSYGNFNAIKLDSFIREVKLTECGLSYAVVAIIGPQSSGKSTLMNHLFNTNFTEMDAENGRVQTTKGIWMGDCVGIEPRTIVMDMEGTDGSDKKDNITFEKQSALFALAISDVVLINMWSHNIGLEHAANKPLLRTVFEVMMRLFSPRKTTLMFVIRDKTKSPFEKLDCQLRKGIQKIWDETPKPKAHTNTRLCDVFRVEVVALSNFEDKEMIFKEEVAQLRQRFSGSISPGGLADDRQGVVSASCFSLSLQQIWKVIKENKDLDLPAHKVMVATARCEEIASQKFNQLTTKEGLVVDWQVLCQTGPEPGFGQWLSSILDTYLLEYDMEATDFDEGIRSSRRQLFMSKALNVWWLLPSCTSLVGYLCSELFEEFKVALKDELLKEGQPFHVCVTICTNSSTVKFRARRADASIRQADWAFENCLEKLEKDMLEHVISTHLAYMIQQNAWYEKDNADLKKQNAQYAYEARKRHRDKWAAYFRQVFLTLIGRR